MEVGAEAGDGGVAEDNAANGKHDLADGDIGGEGGQGAGGNSGAGGGLGRHVELDGGIRLSQQDRGRGREKAEDDKESQERERDATRGLSVRARGWLAERKSFKTVHLGSRLVAF